MASNLPDQKGGEHDSLLVGERGSLGGMSCPMAVVLLVRVLHGERFERARKQLWFRHYGRRAAFTLAQTSLFSPTVDRCLCCRWTSGW
jgi:hypothetical protein